MDTNADPVEFLVVLQDGTDDRVFPFIVEALDPAEASTRTQHLFSGDRVLGVYQRVG